MRKKYNNSKKQRYKGYFLLAIWLVSLLLGMEIGQVFQLSRTVDAAELRFRTDYQNYNYDRRNEPIPAPEAYRLYRSISASDLGVPSLSGMTAAFVTDDTIYVAQEDSILLLNKDYSLRETLTEFTIDGKTQKIQNPAGLFVDDNGNIYVTEPDRGRILLFSNNLELIRAMGKPDAIGLEEVTYAPRKLVVDRVGRMFVISRNVYEGILELTPSGNFTRFFGVNTVKFNPLEIFWRKIATEAQRQKMRLWLPTDFSNLAITDDGFIYATVGSRESSSGKPIKLFNSKGNDILRYPKKSRPIGDFEIGNTNGSSFISIDQNEYGTYMALDSSKGRVFSYNQDGYLLSIFGGLGSREGLFQTPVDARFDDERIIVVDQLAQTLEVFEPTDYGKLINLAVAADHGDDPDAATEYWTQVSEMNPYFHLAYVSMGDTAYRQGNYADAKEYYRKGGDRKGYSDAMKQTRSIWLSEHISWVLGALAALVLFLIWWLVIQPQRRRRQRRNYLEQEV